MLARDDVMNFFVLLFSCLFVGRYKWLTKLCCIILLKCSSVIVDMNIIGQNVQYGER